MKLVLLMDEVDELNDYDPRINQKLRSLFMKSFAENLVSVVSGVEIKKHWEREGSPWYNFFEEIEVKPFRREDAVELIERPIRGVFKLEDGVVDRILAVDRSQALPDPEAVRRAGQPAPRREPSHDHRSRSRGGRRGRGHLSPWAPFPTSSGQWVRGEKFYGRAVADRRDPRRTPELDMASGHASPRQDVALEAARVRHRELGAGNISPSSGTFKEPTSRPSSTPTFKRRCSIPKSGSPKWVRSRKSAIFGPVHLAQPATTSAAIEGPSVLALVRRSGGSPPAQPERPFPSDGSFDVHSNRMTISDPFLHRPFDSGSSPNNRKTPRLSSTALHLRCTSTRLTDEEARDLVCQRQLQSEAPRFEDEIVERIRSHCDNHPYLIQLVCKRYLETGRVCRSAIDQVAADRMVSFFFSVDFDMLPDHDRDIIHVLAEQTAASSDSIHESLSVDEDVTRESLLRLQNLGFIRRDPAAAFRAGELLLSSLAQSL